MGIEDISDKVVAPFVKRWGGLIIDHVDSKLRILDIFEIKGRVYELEYNFPDGYILYKLDDHQSRCNILGDIKHGDITMDELLNSDNFKWVESNHAEYVEYLLGHIT